ncbi:flagellar hook protein FlgE [Piscinibacterium candidicorallinum]|uniref:Flagellar hook protein FlgE n=1 Tax=Piscinibacterium candidicorallinum TaxID=1793872 RepID=A0ABV7H5T2_9BURK
MGFQQGLSGLNAASRNLDVIGTNVANSGTVGFKASRTEFADMFANSMSGAGGLSAGIGVNVAAIAQQFTQGGITTTNNPLDIAINGQGFFRMSTNGAVTYSRNGQFKMDNQGYIVNNQGARLTGFPADATGQINTGGARELRLDTSDVAPRASTEVGVAANLDSRNTPPVGAFDVNDPTTYNSATSLTVYDSLGNAQTLSLYYRKTGNNAWDVYAAANGTMIGSGRAGNIAFNSDGSFNAAGSSNPMSIAVPVTGGAATPLTVSVDQDRLTQFGNNFSVAQLSQDGYAAGRIAGFTIDGNGVILGRYTNGQTLAQGQIVLSNFTNAQGLVPVGGNAWVETTASGQPLTGAPNSGALGGLQAGALEDSNVDLTGELVNMITAQRMYQANAQTVRTQDQVLQTLVNLR